MTARIKIILVCVVLVIVGAVFVIEYTETKEQKNILPMTITSSIFQDSEYMNERYTCDGHDKNPPLRFGEVPQDAKSLVLIVDDPDAPGGNFTHWLVWNIPTTTESIKEGELPEGSVQGKNGAGKLGYMGPCPPTGRAHHYHFKLYALDTVLDLPEGGHQYELESRIQKHILESAEIIGLYARSSIPR